MDGQEGSYLDAGGTHVLEKRAAYRPAAHVVVDDAYLDATAGLVDEGIGDEAPQGVVVEDVDIDVDVVTGGGNVAEQFGEEGIAVGHDVYLVVLEGQRHALVDKEVYQLALALRNAEVLLLYEVQHGALGELVHGALADHALPSVVDAEEEVEDDADNGYEEDDQCPGHGLGRLAVVHDDMDDGGSDEYPCQRNTYYI